MYVNGCRWCKTCWIFLDEESLVASEYSIYLYGEDDAPKNRCPCCNMLVRKRGRKQIVGKGQRLSTEPLKVVNRSNDSSGINVHTLRR